MPIQKNQRNFLGNALDSFDKAVSIRPLTLIFGSIILISSAVLITYVSLALKLGDLNQQANNLQPQPSISNTGIPTPTLSVDKSVSSKTYINKEYGYIFRYPSDWLLEEEKLYANELARQDLKTKDRDWVSGKAADMAVVVSVGTINESRLKELGINTQAGRVVEINSLPVRFYESDGQG